MGGLALWWMTGSPSPVAVAAQRAALLDAPGDGDWLSQRLRYEDALHPFLGYVADPGEHPTATLPGFDATSIELGFPRNRASLLAPRAPDEVIVAIVGGSVAHLLADGGAQALRNALEGQGRFAGKRVRVVSAAMPGYKQPQQLMAVAWLVALGAPLDIVINLDGFNELVLPPTEHVPAGVFPLYPRGWNVRVDRLGRAAQVEVARITGLRVARERRAAAFDALPLGFSPSANALWLALDRADERALAEANETLAARQDAAHASYQARGPDVSFGDGELLEELVRSWARSSRALAGLCASHGIAYFHFLQPNQYFPGDKPLTDDERRNGYRADQAYRRPAEEGHALLEREGAELARSGIHYRSLVRVFAGIDETLYVDDCCHFNKRGLDLVAEAMAREILEADER